METCRGVVYPHQCDAMGHLTTKEYLTFFDVAEWHCMALLGFDARLIHDERIGMADVRHVIDYRKELLAGDLVRCDSAVLRVGGKSITTAHNLYDATTGDLCASLECVTVQYDLARRQAIPLLDGIRSKAEAWLRGDGR